MKKRINLVVALMAICTAFLLGLQLYWNYQAYQNSVKTFKSETNDALDQAVERLANIRRDEIAAEYKKWLTDTSLIVITCKYDTAMKATIFSIADRHPPRKMRRPFPLSIGDYKEKTDQITPYAKSFFINHFINHVIYNDLKSAVSYYYTQRLGDMLVAVYAKDRLNMHRLDSLYERELQKKDITAAYRFRIKDYPVKGFSETNEPLPGYSFATRSYKYGFKMPDKEITAWFPDPNLVFLQRMKWVLLSSLILIGITIFCFTYTTKIIFSQKKLADLKNDFVNNMTHELKTPVATINIAAEAMQGYKLSKESEEEYLGIIRYQAGHLAQLIDEILKSVVVEQENIELNLSPIGINQLIDQLLLEYKPQADKAGVQIFSKIASADIMVMGDRQLLKNAISNLLDNALKYGGNNSQIKITCNTENGNMLLKIADNGIGIPSQYQDKIFDRFFRVPSGDVHNVKGYGLGLSYAKSIIERHNGTISFTSKENIGTEFIISIPITS
jgi:two-component system phosphate regulon sensor histidine kinase PhoR